MSCSVDHSTLTKNFCTECGAKISASERASFESKVTYNSNFPPAPPPRVVEFGTTHNAVQPTNGLAIAGFVLSIVGCGFPIGLILSAIALGQFKKDPNQKGKGLAIAGLVIGIISVVFLFFYFVVLAAAVSGY